MNISELISRPIITSERDYINEKIGTDFLKSLNILKPIQHLCTKRKNSFKETKMRQIIFNHDELFFITERIQDNNEHECLFILALKLNNKGKWSISNLRIDWDKKNEISTDINVLISEAVDSMKTPDRIELPTNYYLLKQLSDFCLADN